MTKEELAEGLRSRLAQRCRRGELDATLPNGRESFLENLQKINHENLIGGFLRCSVCGRMSMSMEEAVKFARHCGSADEWIKFLIGWQQHFGSCRHDAASPKETR